jgi:hypothetical protein
MAGSSWGSRSEVSTVRMERAATRAGLLLAIAVLAGCGGADTGGPGAGPSVTIDLRPLQASPAGALQTDCVTAIAEAILNAGAGSEQRLPIAPGALSVTFEDVDVDQGAVPFSVSITSDNGTELYGKDTTVRIEDTTFSVAMTVDKRGPVLQVCPGHITLDRGNQFADFVELLEVRNRGIGTLTYQAESPDCPAGPCLDFSEPTGSVDGGGTHPFFAGLVRMSTSTSLEMRVQSPVGSVPVAVTLGRLPDVVVESAEVIGTPVTNDSGDREITVTVTVRNDGNVPADSFKVAAEYDTPAFTDTSGARFSVPDNEGSAAFAPGPFAPGATITFTGVVVVTNSDAVGAATLRMKGDSCFGDEELEPPPFCRVDEFDENNNLSQDLPVTLP